jgi:hypothetical protein
VVLPLSEYRNELYAHINNSQPPHEVILLGSKAYQDVLQSIMRNIGNHAILANSSKDDLKRLEEAAEGENAAKAEARERLKEAEKLIETLNNFYSTVTKIWRPDSQRILGHVAYAPPISVGVGEKLYTEDWALVELYRKKIDWKIFKGNVIFLGTFRIISLRSSSLNDYHDIQEPKFRAMISTMMYPYPSRRRPSSATCKFETPRGQVAGPELRLDLPQRTCFPVTPQHTVQNKYTEYYG